jgi:hypothetical protein
MPEAAARGFPGVAVPPAQPSAPLQSKHARLWLLRLWLFCRSIIAFIDRLQHRFSGTRRFDCSHRTFSKNLHWAAACEG